MVLLLCEMENKRGGHLTSLGTSGSASIFHLFCILSFKHSKFMILQPEWYSFLFKMQKKKKKFERTDDELLST